MSHPKATDVLVDDARGSWVRYLPGVVDASCSRLVTADLVARAADFDAGEMLVDGRPRPTPRLCIAFGDERMVFPDLAESGPWPEAVDDLRRQAESLVGHPFNYVLANWYRDGRDHAGWHADKMQFHEPGSSIVIVSFGTERRLSFRRIDRAEEVVGVDLADGSMLWMGGSTQRYYEHALLPDGSHDSRYSLTFRWLLPISG